MADNAGTAEGTAPEAEETGRSPWLLLAPALTFLAGLLLGVAVMGAGELGEEPDTAATPAPSRSTVPSPERSEPELVVRVPVACVEIADEARAARRRVDEAAAAARDLDARRLREALDALQTLQRRVETLAEHCRQRARTETSRPS